LDAAKSSKDLSSICKQF